MEKDAGPRYQAVGVPSAQPRPYESPRKRTFGIALIPVLHLVSCFALAVCMIYVLDGYSAGGSGFKLRVSDVTTLISAAVTVIKLLVGAWTGTTIWNCIFMLLESTGMTMAQINRINTYYVPPFTRRRMGAVVALLLLLVVPQQFISPIITGSVGWKPGFEYNPTLAHVQAGNPDSRPTDWDWYYYATRWRRSFVRRAAAFASITWGETIPAPDRSHCRHITTNGIGITVNSTLLNATMPCIHIHSITFPSTPVSTRVFELVRNAAFTKSDLISRVEEPPFLFLRDGNAVLFDPDDRPGFFEKLPPQTKQANSVVLHMARPSDYLHSGLLTAVVLINGSTAADGSNCTKLRDSIFGARPFANVFAPLEPNESNFYDTVPCFTYAIVNLTAGVVTSPTSTFISSRVVEADNRDLDIRAAAWVQEAIYLLPDVMSTLTMMNTTALDTWDTLEQYIDRLVRYSYQATWDMLFRSFDVDTATLPVRIYEERLVADVSRRRVLAWLLVSLLLPLSSLLLVFSGTRSRPIVLDGTVAALLTDPSPVLNQVPDLARLSYVAKEDDSLGALQLRETKGGYALHRRRGGARKEYQEDW